MPAPDTLVTQTPGQSTTQDATDTSTTAEQPTTPVYSAKHNGGGRWKIWSATTDDWFSDFVASGEGAKDAAQAEADRLNAGGEPFVKPAETAPEVPAATEAPVTQGATEQPVQARQVAVLTADGWLVPELPANPVRE